MEFLIASELKLFPDRLRHGVVEFVNRIDQIEPFQIISIRLEYLR